MCICAGIVVFLGIVSFFIFSGKEKVNHVPAYTAEKSALKVTVEAKGNIHAVDEIYIKNRLDGGWSDIVYIVDEKVVKFQKACRKRT